MVHSDQNGIVQGRQGFHNTPRVLNILYEKAGNSHEALLSLEENRRQSRMAQNGIDCVCGGVCVYYLLKPLSH